MKRLGIATAVALALSAGYPILGLASSSEDAAKLKTTLSPLGAERAGNADGSVPAWTGEVIKAPGGHVAGNVGPAPFADEKPLFTITAANMDKYADKLSEAAKYMLKTYPDYKLDVYPTHRTGVAPQWVYDNTFKNATRAKAEKDGLDLVGAYGGIPFPIPKSGIELIWNHYARWQGSTIRAELRNYLVTADGRLQTAAYIDTTEQYGIYNKSGDVKSFDGVFWQHKGVTTAPSRSAGEALIGIWYSDFKDKDVGSWQYLPGQRRVRKLPNVNYDTPNFFTSGVTQFDESYGFFGKPDQMDFRIVGKKEMYVPYNTNKLNMTTADKAFGPHFPNADLVRWELHRVWEVEATVKAGQRNVTPKRHLYFDEDTWTILTVDEWDAQGKLYRGLFAMPFYSYDLPGVVGMPFICFDFQARAYSVAGFVSDWKAVDYLPASNFNPDSMVQDALR